MSVTADNATARWAVLIGINYYRKDRCLEGSVRDAETIEHYLKAGANHVDIAILTATTPLDPSSGCPIEKPELWPTRANVVSRLTRVLDKAKPGDFVYIHYSGHGTKTPGMAQSTNSSIGELALVLFEHDEIGSSYLRGRHLAGALQKMVKKGLLVTLVLDCCFSGSVVRNSDCHDLDVRSIDYNAEIDVSNNKEYEESLFDVASTWRDSRLERSWLLDPDGYTILSACGPHEKAWELEAEGERRGALTYFLLDALGALRQSDVELTHQSLHEYLRTRFHASWPRQTPMRYGNTKLSFFGNSLLTPDVTFISIFRTHDSRLCLRAGQVHGVHKGDEYAVYPFEMSEHIAKEKDEAPMIVKVDAVRYLESDLVELKPTLTGRQISTGWKARPITSLSPRKIRVGLLASVDEKGQWSEAAKDLRFLDLCTEQKDEEPCTFNVTVKNYEFEVVDALHEKVVGLPTIPLDSNGAISAIMNVLQHLATYKYFEGVDNRLPSTIFKTSLLIVPNCAAGASGYFSVRHGSTWGFTVENTSDKPLYMAIFNFTSSWEISNLISSSGGNNYLVILPRTEGESGKEEILLQMEIPDFLRSRGEVQCEDIVKVFITSKPTSFPAMILPNVHLNANRMSEQVHVGDELSKFLSEITSHFRVQSDRVEEEWATRNFIIRTTME
jgi:hypothetical protein